MSLFALNSPEINMKLQRRHTTFTAASVALGALAALMFTTDPSAKPMRGPGLGAALEACILADDAQYAESSTKFACCSRDAGLCVVCPQPPRADNVCEVVNYRTAPIPGSRPMSAASVANVRQQMQLPPRGTKAQGAATPILTPPAKQPAKP
jgi:hypothetical protein